MKSDERLAHWLKEAGLGDKLKAFEEGGVDFDHLRELKEDELKELGLGPGHRKKFFAALESPVGALVERLPTPLARALEDYAREENPRVRLWSMCDSVEILLRLLVFVGIGALAGREGTLPDGVRGSLASAIESPTLGRWFRMAKELAEAGRKAKVAGSLFEAYSRLLEEVLSPLIGEGKEASKDPSKSLLALRNTLAHGGGVSQALAKKLLGDWEARFTRLWTEDLASLQELLLLARDGEGNVGMLRGTAGQLAAFEPGDGAELKGLLEADAAVAARWRGQVVPLWPLALFGPVRRLDEKSLGQGEDATAQVYVRRGELGLEYTPIGHASVPVSRGGQEALERFLRLLALDTAQRSSGKHKRFEVSDFEGDFAKIARDRRGREAELERLREAAEESPEGVLWVWGQAGMGKSYVVGSLAHEWLERYREDPEVLVLAYRLQASDRNRCRREAFLRFANERLAAWLVAGEDPWRSDAKGGPDQDKALSNDQLLKVLQGHLERAAEAGRRVRFVLDGLDEIAASDPGFAKEIPLGVRAEGVSWICAGRPERGLSEAFAEGGARSVFGETGLPPMTGEDVRELLLSRIGPMAKVLLKQDREDEEGHLGNAFVEKVVQVSDGFPLYVKYLVADICAGRYRVLDVGEQLPQGLDAYHEELLRRLSVGDLQQVLTPLAVALALAREPLSVPALVDLLHRRDLLEAQDEEATEVVRSALSAIESMVRRATTPEGEEGYSLYHDSMGEHMRRSEHTRQAIGGMRNSLARMARETSTGALAPYLFRQGIAHLIDQSRTLRDKGDEDGGSKRLGEAAARLTDFDYLMRRLQTVTDPEGVIGIGEDWRDLLAAGYELQGDQPLWEAFWREREHILRRGETDRWPAYKILLQLAVEHADDSPVTRQAEAWLEADYCDWVWLCNQQRPEYAAPDPCLRVFEGHKGPVTGALVLKGERVLSWSADNTLRVWDVDTGEAVAVLSGHTDDVDGALQLSGGRVLTWSKDGALRVWNFETGEMVAELAGYKGNVSGVLPLTEDRLLSWSEDGTLRIWDAANNRCVREFKISTEGIRGARKLRDGSILLWSGNGILRKCDLQTGESSVVGNHKSVVSGAIQLQRGRFRSWFASWSDEGLISVFCPESEEPERVAVQAGKPNEIIELSDGRLLSSSFDQVLLWDVSTGETSFTPATVYGVLGCSTLSEDRVILWGFFGHLMIWDIGSDFKMTTIKAHSDIVSGVRRLEDGRVISWSRDGTLRLWDFTGSHPQERGQAFIDNMPRLFLKLSTGRFVTVHDRALPRQKFRSVVRLWDPGTASYREIHGHQRWVDGLCDLRNGSVVTWFHDGNLLVWGTESGERLADFNDDGPIGGCIKLDDERLLSWRAFRVGEFNNFMARDGALRIWNVSEVSGPKKLVGHKGWVRGVRHLGDDRLISWSTDHAIWIWDVASENGKQLGRHRDTIDGLSVLGGGRVVSWSQSNLYVWDTFNAALEAEYTTRGKCIRGVFPLRDRLLVVWSGEEVVKWDIAKNEEEKVLTLRNDNLQKVKELGDGRLLFLLDTEVQVQKPDGVGFWKFEKNQEERVSYLGEMHHGKVLKIGDRIQVLDTVKGGVSNCIEIRDAPWREPTLLYEAQKPRTVDNTTSYGFEYSAGIACNRKVPPACWESSEKIWITHLGLDASGRGFVVVVRQNDKLCFLNLYQGNKPISIAEYEAGLNVS